MNNIVSVKLDSRYASTLGVWQYDYGQVLRITGPELPPAVEVQFSLAEKSGETLSRVGTTVDGVTEVKIPDELLTHSATSDYRIYAYIYLTDETSGNTKYEITIPVRVRSKPTSPAEDPETDPDLFRETVVAVSASAERAENAASSAMESATEAGKYAASASKSAVTAEKTKEDALRKVGEKKREAIEAIQNQEETSVGKITTHTDGEIQRIQNQATDSKAGLEQTITNADASKKELEHSIETAGTSKTALDKSVELAGTAKTELDTSIREAGTAKTALDESTETAGTVREDLSATVKQAGALDTSLGEKIKTGTQLKTDLVASGEKAVQDIRAAGSEQLGKMQAVAEAFTADREQIATNKEDIGSLKENLSNKITKFYASNQGETHLADSDNGKIMDMMLYGKTEQFTATGKNLLKIRDGAQTTRGVTVTAKDGVVALKGTATETGWAILDIDSFVLDGTCILSSNISTGVKIVVANKSFKQVLEQNKSNTLENAEASKVCFTITGGKTYNISNILVQIEKGSKATSYEPYVGGQPSPSPDYPQEIKSVVNPTVKVTNEDGLKVQSATLNNITLNAIPVASGGNVTIDGQQWVCDEIDLKRGVRVQRVYEVDVDGENTKLIQTEQYANISVRGLPIALYDVGQRIYGISTFTRLSWYYNTINGQFLYLIAYDISDQINESCKKQMGKIYYVLATPIETPLTSAEIAAFNAFITYYPVTNISVNSEQLDGYTVFNYPISMENGWNYVKQQLGDTRDYIYDMDAKAQDIDIQSAEAYVNSEYAVALTELEV